MKRILDDMIREDEKIKRQKRAEILGLKKDDDVEDSGVVSSSVSDNKVENSESVFQTEQIKFGMGLSSSNKINLENPPSVFANNQDDNVSEQKVDELGRVIREVVCFLEFTLLDRSHISVTYESLSNDTNRYP